MDHRTSLNELLRVLMPRIEAAIEHAGLLAADFSELSGVSADRLGAWRRGESAPGIVDVCRIAAVCDVDLAWFFVPVDAAREAIAWGKADTQPSTI
jgi:transcriptional regulator with XRE-family HTH domain